MSKTKRELQLQREIEAKLRRTTTNAIENIPTSTPTPGSGGISEAPIDGNLYGRKDGGWETIPAGGLTQEEIEDVVGALIADSSDLDFTYDDPTPDITAVIKNGVVSEAKMILADNTTHNVSTTMHGFVPKAPNDVNQFLRGDGVWAVLSFAFIFNLSVANVVLQEIGSISGTFILNLPLP